jgi:hypothetical protein
MEFPVQTTLNLIRENLNDRPKSGFPIIQELVQNADDAKARRLDIGWTVGLPSAQHPLLRGPAIFVANDGAFSDREARAINSILLSSKSGEQTAIGKFGLGLKSIFLLCEAFFYISWESASEKSRGAIVNPWADGLEHDDFHAGWDVFGEEDRQAVIGHLRQVLPEARYLCLWIPLRQERHYPGKHPIMRNNLGDVSGVPEPLKNIDSNLALLLPLLSSLERVQGWTYDLQSGGLERTFRIQLEPGAHRRRYPELDPDRTVLFGGGIEQTDGLAATKKTHLFCGAERLASDPVLTRLKESDLWPLSSGTDQETGEYKSDRDKAEQHCAAYFLRYPAEGDQGRLDIRQAVFLPVGEPIDSLPIDGGWFYQLVLHGYFFVDAGRSQLEGLDYLPNDETRPDGAPLRKMWNSRLARQGTFRLVLPALKDFVSQTHSSDSEIGALTSCLAKTGFFRSYKEDICAAAQWVRCFNGTGPQWQLVDAQDPLYEIPEPDDWSLVGDALPAVALIAERNRITTAGSPRLTCQRAARWTEPMLIQALDIPVQAVLGHRERLSYLNDWLQLCYSPVTPLPGVVTRLCDVVREGFLSVELSQLRKHDREIGRLLTLIPEQRKLVFNNRSTIWDAVLSDLLNLELGVLLVPGGLESQQRADDGAEQLTTEISADDAVRVLQVLAKPRPELENEKGLSDVCSRIALKVIRATAIDRPQTLARCGDLPLFRGQGEATLLSWNTLRGIHERGTLFQIAPGKEYQFLRQALPEERVALLDRDTAQALVGESGLTSCDAQACLRVLLLKPRLSAASDRIDLLSLVQSLVENPSYRPGVRYLLHGHRADDDGPLFAGTSVQSGTIWAKLLGEVLARNHTEWHVVPAQLAAAIPEQRWPLLGIRRFEPSVVIEELNKTDLEALDCSRLTVEERQTLLLEIQDLDLLRRMKIHEDLNGTLVSLTREDTYLDGPFRMHLPGELLQSLHVIRQAGEKRQAERQGQLIEKIDAATAIQIALKQQQPYRFWRLIMDALSGYRTLDTLGQGLKKRLRETPWLLTRDDRSVAPQNVVSIPELEDEVSRLVPKLGGEFVDGQDLHPDIRANTGFGTLASAVLPGRDQALTMLGMIMGDNDAYRVGNIAGEGMGPSLPQELLRDLLQELLKVFQEADREVMPAIPVLKVVSDRLGPSECQQYLLPGLLADIPAQRLQTILNYLVDQHKQVPARAKEPYSRLYNRYLAAAVRLQGFKSNTLPRIQLLSQTSEWRSAGELCARTSGIDPSVILDDTQWKVLQGVLPQEVDSVDAVSEGILVEPTAESSTLLEMLTESASVLAEYFKDWEDEVDREIVGGFLSLLGDDPDTRTLAESYLGNRDLSVIRELLEWRCVPDPVLEASNVHLAMQMHHFLVKIAEGSTAAVPSLLGSTFDAPLVRDSELRNLLVDDADSYFGSRRDPTRQFHRLVLRRVPAGTNAFPSERLSLLLRETARYVLVKFYHQANPNIDQVWEELARSEQLDIRIAQTLLLNSAFFYVKQLGINTDPQISLVLKDWGEAQRQQAECEAAAAVRREVKSVSQDQTQRARDRFRELIERDEQVQSVMLRAVRRKIEQDQYRQSSVPFELLQNADDAAVELAAMLGSDGDLVDMDRFVVSRSAEYLDFVHWGRPINEFRLGGFGNYEGRARGYDRDLEKMLILSYSDKQGENGSGPTVTGRFGLGFKSIFIVCEQPEILSGRLGFRVIGGLYPQSLDESSRRTLREELRSLSASDRAGARGTIIRLPVGQQEQGQEFVLARLEQLVHIMLVFNRKIKRFELRAPSGEVRSTAWHEMPLSGVRGVHTGRLSPLSALELHAPIQALLCRSQPPDQEGALLLGLGARGFVSLPASVPTLWVTAPTAEEYQLGFAVNGPFALDVGRAQLARNSEENESLARSIGCGVGKGLVALFNAASESGWPNFRTALALAEDTGEYEFWASLWHVTASSMSERMPSDVPILSAILWGSPNNPTGIGRLISACPALPTHLWGAYRCLTRYQDVKYAVQGRLDQDDVFPLVSQWPRFQSRYRPGTIVSEQRTCKVLHVLWPDSWNVKPLNLGDAILEEMGAENRADPAIAERLGELVNRDFLAKVDPNEGMTIRERLREVCFFARNGRLCRSRELVIAHDDSGEDVEPDEQARARFAPEERQLAESYHDKALAFFKACRGPLSAPAKEMAEWCLAAASFQGRRGVLQYLFMGGLAREMGAELRPRIADSWLGTLTDAVLQQVYGFEDRNERYVILGHLGLGEVLPIPLPILPLDPHKELPNIYEWWHTHREELLREYESRLYPDAIGAVRVDEFDPRDINDRAQWLTLFLLGSFHTMGRVRPQQHRGFLELFWSKRWFQVFADPESLAEDWIGVLEAYIEEQTDQPHYYEWVKQFVPIYHLARRLEDYREMFLEAQRWPQPFGLDLITSSRTSEMQQHGGPDAPPITRVLGIGACFVMRELVRHRVITSPFAYEHCYVPSRTVRTRLISLGCPIYDSPRTEYSRIIHRFLVKHLGEERATFDLSFDLPFLLRRDDV